MWAILPLFYFMTWFYLSLRLQMLRRHLRDFGVNPVVAFFIVMIVFFGLSSYIFSKVDNAFYLYPLFALLFVLRSEARRKNEFLKSCYSNKNYYKIKIVENFIIILPFSIFLIIKGGFLSSIAVLIVSALLTFFSDQLKRNTIEITLPTPFSKFPFEFTRGFRKNIIIFLLTYSLTVISLVVSNFNLGVFALIITHFTSTFFFVKPEKEFFVWIHSKKSVDFLLYKIKTTLINGLILTMPLSVALTMAYPQNFLTVFFIQLAGLSVVILSLLLKYSTYPNELNIIELFFIVLSFAFPPLILFLVPFFFSKSVKRLKPILG
jgi:hypothetical protein